MVSTALKTAFELVEWITDKALDEGEYIQPQKLHNLLFLSQAYYSIENKGNMLIPAIFVAGEFGPIEPNIYRVFESGKPYIESDKLSGDLNHFMDGIWRKFGCSSANHLSNILKRHKPYKDARESGIYSIISHKDIYEFYSNPVRAMTSGNNVSSNKNSIMGKRYMRSQDGKAVAVKKWVIKKSSTKPIKTDN